ncbi:MAG: hypothetical protein ABSB96_05875 [Gaiellaceae bacterium]
MGVVGLLAVDGRRRQLIGRVVAVGGLEAVRVGAGEEISGLLGLLWLVMPSILAFVLAKDMPFPTLFRTIKNLEDWLKTRTWRWSLGPILAWLVSYVILAGLVILLLHLTLYPYPNITKVLNPTG